MAYACTACRASVPLYLGRCPACNAWGTMRVVGAPTIVRVPTARASFIGRQREQAIADNRELGLEPDESSAPDEAAAPRSSAPVAITTVSEDDYARVPSGMPTLDRVLGGGFVAGSAILIGGDAGLGKSSLVTQALALAKIRLGLYVSGEETIGQVAMRARRVDALRSHFLIVAETDIDAILEHAESLAPELMIVDSIQTTTSADCESEPGSVAQIRACTTRLVSFAKRTGTIVVVIGHITKDGALAGPKVLEHLVDVVLLFELAEGPIRNLVAFKNRFGSTIPRGIFEMTDTGVRGIEPKHAMEMVP